MRQWSYPCKQVRSPLILISWDFLCFLRWGECIGRSVSEQWVSSSPHQVQYAQESRSGPGRLLPAAWQAGVSRGVWFQRHSQDHPHYPRLDGKDMLTEIHTKGKYQSISFDLYFYCRLSHQIAFSSVWLKKEVFLSLYRFWSWHNSKREICL